MSRESELKKIEEMIEEVAGAMYLKCEMKYDEGYRGWDDPGFFMTLSETYDAHEYKFRQNPNDPENILDMMNILSFMRHLIATSEGKVLEGIKFVPDPNDSIMGTAEEDIKAGDRVDFNLSTGKFKVYRGEEKSLTDQIAEVAQETIDLAKEKEEDTKELPPIIDMDKLAQKVEEITTPNEEAKEKLREAGMKFLYEVKKDEGDKKSFDITPLMPEGKKGVTFFPFDNYIYIDTGGGVHAIKIAQVDFGVFMYQILSVYGRKSLKFTGEREDLFALIEEKILKYIELSK
jgi:hypothetical protein